MKIIYFITLILSVLIINIPNVSAQKSENIVNGHSNYAINRNRNNNRKSKNPKDDMFYFFKLHDYNKDGELDGNELFASFIDNFDPSIEEKEDMGYIMEWVDHILDEDDIDGNGKISWYEYLSSQKYHTKEY